MNKLIVCIMGQNCEKHIGMCLDSVKDCDHIIYCDGGSTDDTISKLDLHIHPKGVTCDECWKGRIEVIVQNYDQEDLGMNGKQRNFYLKYLKEHYPNDWALILDADEVVEDGGIQKIKDFIKEEHKHTDGQVVTTWSPRMRHLISDLAHEDSIQPTHFVLHRLFKISDVDSYPEVEHPVLKPIDRDWETQNVLVV